MTDNLHDEMIAALTAASLPADRYIAGDGYPAMQMRSNVGAATLACDVILAVPGVAAAMWLLRHEAAHWPVPEGAGWRVTCGAACGSIELTAAEILRLRAVGVGDDTPTLVQGVYPSTAGTGTVPLDGTRDDEAPIADLDCGKARRKERHPAHTWWLQSSDDGPLNEQVWCDGFRPAGDDTPEALK